MNNVQLVGRLVRDPKKTEGTTSITKFTVACDRMPDKDGNRKADFISCIAFGKTADMIASYFFKGRPIGLNGRIQTGSYEGRDGKTVYTTDVIVERVEFLPREKTEAVAPKKQDDEYPDQHRVREELDGLQQAFAAIDEEVPF
jgi:single-strand DNA-binding protein